MAGVCAAGREGMSACGAPPEVVCLVSFLSAEPASRTGYVERSGQRTWAVVRDRSGSKTHCRPSASGPCLGGLLAACRSYPSCCVVYACVLRVEGRTTAPGSRCSSRRCHAEERRTTARTRCEARTGRRMAARRALGRGHDGAVGVGDLSDGDARHAGVWWSTRNAGRGQRGRATGHCSARRGICPRMQGR